MILLLDNYDSFTWNLYHYLCMISDSDVIVKRNDEITLHEVDSFSSIVLSPGPGLPSKIKIMNDIIKTFGEHKPILGVCLGMQAIGEAYGGRLKNLNTVQHGVQRTVMVVNSSDRLMNGLPSEFMSGRYHSWVIDNKNFPEQLEVTATDNDGEIMAISHKTYPLSGIQFHPESIMTPDGYKLLQNWIQFTNSYNA